MTFLLKDDLKDEIQNYVADFVFFCTILNFTFSLQTPNFFKFCDEDLAVDCRVECNMNRNAKLRQSIYYYYDKNETKLKSAVIHVV